MTFQEVMERVGQVVDATGVGIIVVGIALATVVAPSDQQPELPLRGRFLPETLALVSDVP